MDPSTDHVKVRQANAAAAPKSWTPLGVLVNDLLVIHFEVSSALQPRTQYP
jgi:hypothetical protein